ncbi:MAG TPA: hypothetical protein VEI46_00470, partial [Thermodesulfovibrionales bacterium]|nr:hypothetical protein [Thermodesulfovibrionales bacterium]
SGKDCERKRLCPWTSLAGEGEEDSSTKGDGISKQKRGKWEIKDIKTKGNTARGKTNQST